jgi:hypothetical protein
VELGVPDPDELGERLSSRKVVEWMAYFNLVDELTTERAASRPTGRPPRRAPRPVATEDDLRAFFKRRTKAGGS